MESHFADDTKKKLILILLIFLITSSVFLATVIIRKPFFGTLSPFGHQWLTGDNLKYCKNWYREGPLDLKFGMFVNPRSVEFTTLSSRGVYSSYPPGAALPVYLISAITGHEPNLAIIMGYNLFNHFLIAFFLSLTIFFFLLRMKFGYLNSFLLALIPVIMELLMPATLYWHQNVFFVDQAVILPYVLFVFLEVVRDNVKSKKGLRIVNIIQGAVFFCGLLTDWLFLFVAVVVYVKRLICKEMGTNARAFIRKSVVFWIPALLVLCLFAVQLFILHAWGQVADKFLFRTGFGGEGGEYAVGFFDTFWKGYIAEGYGSVAIILLWGSLIIFTLCLVYAGYKHFRGERTGEGEKSTLSLIAILLIPCFLQVYVFRNHSAIHSFSALKFSIPLATVPLVLVPVLIYFFIRNRFKSLLDKTERSRSYSGATKSEVMLLIVLFMVCMAAAYVFYQSPRFLHLFPASFSYDAEEFIAENTQYQDVVFSPEYEIPAIPPQQLAIAMKRVYREAFLPGIYNVVEKIDDDYVIGLFLVDEGNTSYNYDMKTLMDIAYERIEANGFSLYKIRKDDFLDLHEEPT